MPAADESARLMSAAAATDARPPPGPDEPPPAPSPLPPPPGPPRRRAAGKGEFLAGDGIRGIGMVCIIMAHLAGGALVVQGAPAEAFHTAYGAAPGAILAGMQLALPMFLVLSGYLISRPYVRAYVLGRPAPSLRRYAMHRVLRIVPVFWLLSALMLVVYGSQHSSAFDWLCVLGFAQVYHSSGAANFIGQAWTIDVEVAFYALVPLSAWVVARATRRVAARRGRAVSPRARVVLVLGLLGAATLASAWLRATTIGSGWTDSPPATFYYFAPGVALAALELEFGELLARGRLPHLALPAGLAAAAITLLLAIGAANDETSLVRARGALGIALATGLAFVALLARQRARGDSPVWLDNRVTRWLGARSYPCYIIQSATVSEAVRIVGRTGGPWTEVLALSALGLPLTIAAGAVVHAAVERPVLAWGRGRSFRGVSAPQA